ncbi:LuxR C-terminal-related transcriptional regulator [Nocardia sp. NBC_00511]|uniref:helix-turn-helix transcriptional regulator n=1 Tax=Nocardia sp. NBC_00511 TaxID=2903591 RepID=UPI0030E4F579
MARSVVRDREDDAATAAADGWRLPVARGMAVLGDAATVARVAALLQTGSAEIDGAIADLRQAGLVLGECEAHPELAARVLRDLPDELRRPLHLAAAELLSRDGCAATAVAAQLMAAGEARGSWAAQALLEVAEQALAADELDSAAALLELAYRAGRRAEERAAIATRLVAVEWRINPSSRTRNFARLKAALRTGRVPYPDLPTTVLHMLWHGFVLHADHALVRLRRGIDGAAAVGDRGAAAVGDRGAAAAGGRLEFLAAWLRYTHPAHAQRHDWLTALPEPVPAERDSPHRQAAALLAGLTARRPPAETAAAAQRILAQHRLTPATVEVLVAAVDCLLHTDRLDAADAWCAALLAEATARRAPTWQALFASARAETLLRKGNLIEAAGHAQVALNLLPAEQLGVWMGRPIAVLVLALTAQGRHAEAAAQLERPVPRALFESRFALAYLRAHGMHCLATDRPEEALRHFRRCGRLMDEWALDFAWIAPWRNDMAAASLAAGQQWQAQTFATRHLDAIGGAESHHTGGVSLRLLAATSEPQRRVTLIRRAAALARAGGDDLELATALADLGVAYRALGAIDRARPPLREATRLAQACGAEPLLARLPGDPGCAPVPKRIEPRDMLTANGFEALSRAELRVAELAAQGHRNRDIAATLDITPSTVEQHLTRVYCKLAVARRSELRFALAAKEDAATRTAVG